MYKEKLWKTKQHIFMVVLIICIFIIGYLRIYQKSWSDHAYDYCIADLILLVSKPTAISFLSMIMSYLFLFFTKFDFNINAILRYKSKRILWAKQCLHIVSSSFIMAIVVVILIYVYGVLCGKQVFNWNMKDSMFYNLNHEVITGNKTYFVIFSVIIIGTLLVSIMSVLCNFIYWITNSKIISCFVIALLCFCNLFYSSCCFNLFDEIKLRETDFIEGNKVMLDLILLPVMLIVIMMVFCVFVNQKEFLNNRERE